MDRNTLLGLGLIGVILAAFTFLNRPSEEEMKRLAEEQELLVEEHKKAAEETDDINLSDDLSSLSETTKNDSIKLLNEDGSPVLDSLGNAVLVLDTVQNNVAENAEQNTIKTAANITEKSEVLENDLIELVLTNKGGGVKSVFLKKHQTYNDYIKNEGTDKIDPLQLFDEEKSTNGLILNISGREINTRDLAFTLEKKTDNYISFVANLGGNKSVKQIYTILPNEYHVNYEIRLKGFDETTRAENIRLDWEVDMLKSERLLSEQRRVSTVFYKETGGKYNYLSEMKDDDLVAKTDLDWIAFKQNYFSSIMMPEKSFKQEGTILKVQQYEENTAMDSTHVKHYLAVANPGITNVADGSIEMKWFFGPNDYDLLKSYNNDYEDLLNYGWGLFRWFNTYIIQPLFVWLASYGFNLGIVILLLTVIIKLVLTPIQWKMYLSSAKMKILKPEIEEINKKYPNKDQAMNKQSEMMSLYKETGSSPLAGCLPMLIQMPILIAVFRFFPSTFTLRQQPFLWADDLSSYDSIYDLGFHIPLYGDHVSLFTLLMAITTLFYTFINSGNQMQAPSQPGMPNMKIIMYFMPIMMIFFFNNYSSGLSYYYFVSTLMSILTMLAIKKFFVDEEKLKAKMANRKASVQAKGDRPKSKFQQRLEEMQRVQQEKAKNAKKKK